MNLPRSNFGRRIRLPESKTAGRNKKNKKKINSSLLPCDQQITGNGLLFYTQSVDHSFRDIVQTQEGRQRIYDELVVIIMCESGGGDDTDELAGL